MTALTGKMFEETLVKGGKLFSRDIGPAAAGQGKLGYR